MAVGGEQFESTEEQSLACRKCGNQMPVDASNCPHCGSRVVTKLQSIGMMVVGVALMTTALVRLWPVAALGVLFLVAGIAFYYGRKQKLTQAASR